MKDLRSLVFSLAVCAAPFVIACDREHHHAVAANEVHQPGEGRTTGAVREIVAARCEREERCNNVGPDKTYPSHTACTSKLEGSTADDINMKDCPNGVSDAKLHECLSKIHGEDCGNPLDTLSRVTACRTGQICL